MFDNEALVLDLVAWRTSCPRLQVWEDAVDHGLVSRRDGGEKGQLVEATEKGRALLEERART